MSRAAIAALRKLCAEASPGPWSEYAPVLAIREELICAPVSRRLMAPEMDSRLWRSEAMISTDEIAVLKIVVLV